MNTFVRPLARATELNSTGWAVRHRAAAEHPSTVRDAALVAIANGISTWANRAWGDGHMDREARTAIGTMLDSWMALLAYGTDALDPGTCDTWAREAAERIGFNIDTLTLTDDKETP
jgi:hypothetical protein